MTIKTELLTGVKINNLTIQTNTLCNKTNYAVCSSRDVKYIVIHYTGNVKDTALNNAKYFQGSNRQASAHFFVDDNSIYQSVALKDRAWHCGSLTNSNNNCTNYNAIGIEMCTAGNYTVSNKTKENTVALTIYLCKLLGITAANVDKYILRHYDVGTNKKSCPAQMVKNTSEWTAFKNAVKDGLVEEKVNLQQWGCLIKDIERLAYIPMDGTKGETLSRAAGRVKWNNRAPDAICNAEFFNMTTYDFASGVVSKANGQANWTDQYGISFVNNIIPKISYKNNLNATDWVAGYPLLLKDGQIAIPAGFNALPGKRARTAIGYDNDRFAMFWVKEEDGCTIEAFANAIKDRGFHTAINLDGGGSTAGATTMWSYEQGRATRGKIGLWVKNGTGNKLQKKTTTTTTSNTTTTNKATAMQQDTSKRYGVNLKISAKGGLNMRSAPSTGTVIEVIPDGGKVKWYGYYCYFNNVKWYYVMSNSGKTGYVSSYYAKEE